jgi:2-dehydro-3-deoxyphosphogalactonate aldolase
MSVTADTLDDLLSRGAPPVIAILRGISPEEIVPVGFALVEAGIRMIEVPLNSPEPLESIRRFVAAVGPEVLVGVGTVVETSQVDAATAAGARLIVAPNTDANVIRRSLQHDSVVIPGFMTASEAFAALAAGARHLKLFPASSVGASHLKALLDVLPQGCRVWAVGGTNSNTIAEWRRAGAAGIGVGGSLYRPGDTPDLIGSRAAELIHQWRSGRR